MSKRRAEGEGLRRMLAIEQTEGNEGLGKPREREEKREEERKKNRARIQ